ncbi:MAG TPA: hypothetical protein VGL35_05810 [Rhizomicrobium sp.]|jgi:hypothetical protein
MRKPASSFALLCSTLLAAGLMAFAPSGFSPAHASVKFVSAPNRVDIAYDDTRGLLYITSGDEMLRYQLSSKSFQTPVTIGGASLMGMDISPDGTTAAIADAVPGASDNYIHLVNLDTLAVTTVQFPLDGAAGTFTTAYGADGKLVVSCEFNGSGWVPLWLYDPASGSETNLGTVTQDTMLSSSANGKAVALAESNNSGGPFGYYRFKSGALNQNGGTGWFNFEIGVNRNATRYAIPTYGGTFIADQNLQMTGTVIGTYAGNLPIAAAFHPTRNLVYFPFTGTTDVEVYNTKTWTLVKSYDFKDTFQWNGNTAFVQGRTRLSKDGSLLFVTVTGGVGYVATTHK